MREVLTAGYEAPERPGVAFAEASALTEDGRDA